MTHNASFQAHSDAGDEFTVMVVHERAGSVPMVGGVSMPIGGGDKFYVDHGHGIHQLSRQAKGVYVLTCADVRIVLRSDDPAAT